MARITTRAAVHVTFYALMVLVRSCLRVASRAGENGIIGRIGMATRTHAIGIAMVRREPCVIECGAGPTGRGVARLARSREASSRMIRVRRVLVISLVAAVARGRQRRVVIVHVATRAGSVYVGAGQRECSVVVVESRRSPRGGVVAGIARLRKPDLRMVRVGSVVVIGHVARGTCRAGQVVIAVHVATRTGCGRVRAGQRKSGG